MIIKETKTYKFEELTEEQQEKAIENYSDFNVRDGYWFEHYTEDNLDIGLKVSEFDIDRGSFCRFECQEDFETIARNIIKTYGKKEAVYQTATNFLESFSKIQKELESDLEENQEDKIYDLEEEKEELEKEFEKELQEDFLSMLRREYEYQTSEEAIKESLIVNDYDFTVEGKIF